MLMKVTMGLVVFWIMSAAVHAEKLPPPNILILMAEDMSAHVGAFGDSVAVTPSLDQLAQEGVRYPNTFTTAGVCAPSRAAHIVGMHQIAFGAQHMRSSNGPTGGYKAVPPPEVKAYPELLRAAGYYTWTGGHKLDYQFSGPQAGSGPFTIWDDEDPDNHWRNRKPGQPFYGLVNFNMTHESGVFEPLGAWPNSLMHLAAQLMRAATLPSAPENSPVKAAHIIVPPYYPDTPTVRSDMARLYNNISVMDRQVGEILAQLEADGLADSTIVIWTTDHGDGLPRAKRELFDSGINVPMIIRWPEAYRPEGVLANSIDERLVSFVDFAPTLLQLAGVPLPDYLQGNNFLDENPRDFVFASRDRIDEVPDRQRAVRNHQYKYIYSWHPDQPGGHPLLFRDNLAMMQELWQLLADGKLNADQKKWFEAPGKEQFYDIVNDPFELNNLVGDERHESALNTFREALKQWQQRVDDWSELSEQTMFERFQPDGEPLVTAMPTIHFLEGQLILRNGTPGASLGYRIDGGRWQLYRGPVAVPSGVQVEAKAIRYGWEESEVASSE